MAPPDILQPAPFRHESSAIRDAFEEMLEAPAIHCHAQPIVRLASRRVLGYELLSRGQAGSTWETPTALLAEAERRGMVEEVDEICRRVLLNEARPLADNALLFVNIHPQSLYTAGLPRSLSRPWLADHGLSPDQIVLELTENHVITDYEVVCDRLQRLRDEGFLIALDDFGAGYAGLTTLIRLRPKFLKIDRSIIANVCSDAFARDLLARVLDLARTTLMHVIAEGIEADTQLEELVRLGVELGQGFMLGRPGPPHLAPRMASRHLQSALVSARRSRVQALNTPLVGELCEPGSTLDRGEKCATVHAFLHGNPEVPGVVITSRDRVDGLVMRNSLMQRLSGRFGFSLYEHRPVYMLAEKTPLIVPPDLPLLEVNSLAMRRPSDQLYDLVIVAEDGALRGVVSVQRLIEATTAIQLTRATYANPLTGLPGNVLIEQEMSRFMREERPFSLIFADLDNFKAFNDLYGFARGDDMIRLTAELLVETFSGPGWDETLVGHVGGDDFLTLAHRIDVGAACESLIQEFRRRVRPFFNAQHQEHGSFPGTDREGRPRSFPLTELTVVALPVEPRDFHSPEQLAAVAAHIKMREKQRRVNRLEAPRPTALHADAARSGPR